MSEPNPYEGLGDQVAAELERQRAPAETPVLAENPYESASKQFRALTQDTLERKAGFLKFLHQNPNMEPERQAEALRLSVATSLPLEAVAGNLDEVRRVAEADKVDWHDIVRTNPVLADWLTDPVNSTLAQDSVPQLHDLGKFWLGGHPLGRAQQLLLLANPVTAPLSVPSEPGMPQRAITEGFRQAELGLRLDKIADEGLHPDADPRIRELRASLGTDYGEADYFLGGMMRGTLGTLGYQAAAWKQGAMWAGAAGGAAMAAGPVGWALAPELALIGFISGSSAAVMRMERGMAYDEYVALMEERGLPLDLEGAAKASMRAGFINGVIEAPAELLWTMLAPGMLGLFGFVSEKQAAKAAVGQLFTRVAVRRAVGRWALNLGGEVAEEALQRASTVIGREQTIKGAGGVADFGTIYPEMVSEAAGAIQSFWLLTLPQAMGDFSGNMNAVRRARQNVDAFKRYGAVVQGIKLAEAAPEKLAELVKSTVAESGHPDTVFAEMKAFETHFQSAGLNVAEIAGQVTGDAKAWEKAKAAGAEYLEIPFDRFTSQIAGTDHLEALADDIKLDLEGHTGHEADALEKDGDRLLKEAEAQAADEKNRGAASLLHLVYETMIERLEGAGFDTRAAEYQAKMYVSVYHAMGQSTGLGLGDLLRQHPLPGLQREGMTPPPARTARAEPLAEAAPAETTPAPTAPEAAPAVPQTFDEYSESQGVSRTPPSFPESHRAAGGVSKPSARAAAKRIEAAGAAWQKERDRVRAEYEAKIAAGELEAPTSDVGLERAAGGEGEAAGAAARVIAKRAARMGGEAVLPVPEGPAVKPPLSEGAQAELSKWRALAEEKKRLIAAVAAGGPRSVAFPVKGRPEDLLFVHQTTAGEAAPWRVTWFGPGKEGIEPNGHTTQRSFELALDEVWQLNGDLSAPEEQQGAPAAPAEAAAPPAAPAPATGPVAVGGADTFAFSTINPDVRYPMRYRLVPLDELVTSHDDSGNPNAAYPQELQQWNRAGAASKGQVELIGQAENFDNFLIEQHGLDRGTPIVGPGEGIVESGNGRTIGLRKARNANSPAWHRYQQQLEQRAAELGLETAGVKDPVLVRERAFGMTDAERVEFTRDANARASREPGPVERARIDAEHLTPDLIARLPGTESGSLDEALMSGEGAVWLREFLSGYAASEWGRFVDSAGRIGTHGLAAIRLALFYRVFGNQYGEQILRSFTEIAGDQRANLEKALMGALPRLARLRGAIDEGTLEPELDVAEDMAAAMEVFKQIRKGGDTVAGYLSQAAMFGEELDPFQKTLLETIDENARRGGRLAFMLDAYANAALAMPPADQGALFGSVRPAKPELWTRAVGEAAKEFAAPAAQGARLFQRAPDLTTLFQRLRPAPEAAAPVTPEAINDLIARSREVAIGSGNALGAFDPEAELEAFRSASPDERAALLEVYARIAPLYPVFLERAGALARLKDGALLLGPVKAISRVLRKARNEYREAGGVRAVRDLLRCTVVVRTAGDAVAMMDALGEEFPASVVNGVVREPKNNFDHPKGNYRDVNHQGTLEGTDVEIQVHVPEILAVKAESHPLYEEVQEINKRIDAGETSVELFLRRDELERRMMVIFDRGWVRYSARVGLPAALSERAFQTALSSMGMRSYTGQYPSVRLTSPSEKMLKLPPPGPGIDAIKLPESSLSRNVVPGGKEPGAGSGRSAGRVSGAIEPTSTPSITPEAARISEPSEEIARPGWVSEDEWNRGRQSYELLKSHEIYFQRAFHGSPVKGIREFDRAFIGSGNGRRWRGHGFYAASRVELAEQFRVMRGSTAVMFRGEPSSKLDGVAGGALHRVWAYTDAQREPAEAVRMAIEDERSIIMRAARSLEISGYQDREIEATLDRARERLAFLEGIDPSRDLEVQEAGQVYELEVPSDAELLDWRLPLSQQDPALVAKLEAGGALPRGYNRQLELQAQIDRIDDRLKDGGVELEERGRLEDERTAAAKERDELKLAFQAFTGSSLYARLAGEVGGDANASAFLDALGVPGIRYEDPMFGPEAAARRYSYVVFHEANAQIVGTLYQRTGTLTEADAHLVAREAAVELEANLPAFKWGTAPEDKRVPITANGARLLAKKLSSKFKAQGFIDLRGTEIKGPAELAYVCRIFRDPRFETHRMFWMKDGAIVAHEAVTSYLPNTSQVAPGGISTARFKAQLRSRMERLGADGYYLVHNHPSGITTPSLEDKQVAILHERGVPGLIASVVIDHGEYSVVRVTGTDAQGGHTLVRERDRTEHWWYDDKIAGLPADQEHDLLGNEILNPMQIAIAGRRMLDSGDHKNPYVLLLYANAYGKTVALEDVPVRLYVNTDRLADHVTGRKRAYGAARVYAYHDLPVTVSERSDKDHLTHGTLGDVVRDERPDSGRYWSGRAGEPFVAREWSEGRLSRGTPGYRLWQQEAIAAQAAPTGGNRGFIQFGPDQAVLIGLLQDANLSTFLHETGHFYFNMLATQAARTGAPAQLQADYQTILEWMGFKNDGERQVAQATYAALMAKQDELGLTPDEQVTFDAIEVQLERFAKGFEAYLMEGKAPSLELVGAFERFRAWLVAIYKSVQTLGVQLSDPVRAVFDRMMATDGELAKAEKTLEAGLVQKDAATAGMTEGEFASYQKLFEQARQEARADLLAEIIGEQKRGLSEVQVAARAEIRKDVEAELDMKPEYQLLSLLRRGHFPEQELVPEWAKDAQGRPAKLDRGALVAMYGNEAKPLLRKLAFTWRAEGGVHPDNLAPHFGYSSGDELVQALAKTEARSKVRDAEVGRRMAAKFGDLLMGGKAGDLAVDALHGTQKGRQLQAELRAAARRGGQAGPQTPADVLRIAARQQIAGQKVRQILPVAFMRAEGKARRAAFDAAVKGDFATALLEKRRELTNYYLYLEARDARKNADAAGEYLARMAEAPARGRFGKAGRTYLDQVDALLERFELKKVTEKRLERRESLRAWVEAQVAAHLDPAISPKLLDEAYAVNWKELTYEELIGLRDAVKNIEHLAGLKNSILTEKGRIAWETAKAELIAQLQATFPEAEPLEVDPLTKGALTRAAEQFKWAESSLKKIQEMVRRMDGDRADGPWHRFVWNPIADAQYAENDLQLEFTKKIVELLEGMGETQRGRLLGEQKFIERLGQSLTYNAMIAVALNMGNASNYHKLLMGKPESAKLWDVDTLEEIKKHLKREDWVFVQGVWDLLEELWPRIEALERRLTGTAPVKIDRQPFVVTFPDGSTLDMPGGYYPVVYKKTEGGRAARLQAEQLTTELFGAGYGRAMTAHGHVIERVEDYAEPIRLNIDVIPRHLAQVIHDLTHREAVISAYKVLTDPDVRRTMYRTIGESYTDRFIPWLKDVANARVVDPRGPDFWVNFVQRTRLNASMVGLGFRASTMLQNVANFAQALDVVKATYLGPAIADFYGAPGEWVRVIQEKSGEMRHRFRALDRDSREQLQKLLGKHGISAGARRFAYYGMALTDAMTIYPTWLAVYRQRVAEEEAAGNADAEAYAARKADEAITLAFGSGEMKDLAAVQRGGELMKLLTMFYTYMSSIYNRMSAVNYDTRIAARNGTLGEDWPRLLARTFFIWIIPALMTEILSGRGPDREGKGWISWAMTKVLLWPALTVPFIRDVASALEGGRDYKYSPAASVGQEITRLVKAGKHYAAGDGELFPLVKESALMTGYAFGLPTGQPSTTVDYLYDLWTGEEQYENPYRTARNLAFSRKPRGR